MAKYEAACGSLAAKSHHADQKIGPKSASGNFRTGDNRSQELRLHRSVFDFFAVPKLCQNPSDSRALELCLSEKQTPQVIVFTRGGQNQWRALERLYVRPRQEIAGGSAFGRHR